MQDPGLAHSVNSGCGAFEGTINRNPQSFSTGTYGIQICTADRWHPGCNPGKISKRWRNNDKSLGKKALDHHLMKCYRWDCHTPSQSGKLWSDHLQVGVALMLVETDGWRLYKRPAIYVWGRVKDWLTILVQSLIWLVKGWACSPLTYTDTFHSGIHTITTPLLLSLDFWCGPWWYRHGDMWFPTCLWEQSRDFLRVVDWLDSVMEGAISALLPKY